MLGKGKLKGKKKEMEYKIFLLFVWLSIKNLKKKNKESILFYFISITFFYS